MKTLLQKLFKLFEQKSPIEEYISSKNPKCAADVEYWTRRYSERRGI